MPFASVQVSLSTNRLAGTLQGMHFQRASYAEAKLVQALRSRAWDVAVELRPDRAVLIPKGFAHGFVTLEDDTELLYATDNPWTRVAEARVRWDDPRFAIASPRPPAVLSPHDAAHPNWVEASG